MHTFKKFTAFLTCCFITFFITQVRPNQVCSVASLKVQSKPTDAPPADSIFGIINAYAVVNAFDCARSLLLVDDPTGFTQGDRVLIIQMQGAKVNLTNTASFGDVVDMNQVGNFEFSKIESINGNEIQLWYELIKPYDLSGSVQLVKVPEYTDVFTGNLTCQPWNGKTGGILALTVKNEITLHRDMDVSGKGFLGGTFIDVDQSIYHETGYTYPINPLLAAQKGTGVAILAPEFSFGRGACANGGGGGNAHNAGGGGGAGAGSGGAGGLEYYTIPAAPTIGTNGMGGKPFLPNSKDKITLGGGGGAGHSNDFVSSNGGAGGGIIILQAGTIKNSTHTIRANGEDIYGPSGNIANDGQGGGGGGGTIVIDALKVDGTLSCSANGGRGGDCLFYVAEQIIGPGGGGGGGKILVQNNVLNKIVPSVLGGMPGTANQNLLNGAASGATGLVLPDPSILNDNVLAFPFKIIELNVVQPECSNEFNGQISVLNETANLFSINLAPFGPNPVFDTLTEGAYFIRVFDPIKNCTKDTIVTLTDLNERYLRFENEIIRCLGDTVMINNIIYTTTSLFRDTLESQTLDCDTIKTYQLQFLPNLTQQRTLAFCPGTSITIQGKIYTQPGTILDTLSSLLQCDTVRTTFLTFTETPRIQRNILLCRGEQVRINGMVYDSNAVVLDTIRTPDNCDTIRLNTIVLDDLPPTDFPQDTFLCPGTVLTLSNPFVDPNNGTPYQPNFSFAQPGVYAFSGRNANFCPESVQITVQTCCNEKGIYVPNIFSPNDDGENDRFCVFPVEACSNYQLQVYDRWGNLLFTGLDAANCWDGTFRDKMVPPGVYTWFLSFFAQDQGNRAVLKGSVTVIR